MAITEYILPILGPVPQKQMETSYLPKIYQGSAPWAEQGKQEEEEVR